jgi:hypothetical protein
LHKLPPDCIEDRGSQPAGFTDYQAFMGGEEFAGSGVADPGQGTAAKIAAGHFDGPWVGVWVARYLAKNPTS